MKTTIRISTVFVCLLMITPGWTQTTDTAHDPASGVVLIKGADLNAFLQTMTANQQQDEPFKVINTGDNGNLGVFLIHLIPGAPPPEPITLMSHDEVTEIYYVISGEGIVYHGGILQNPTERTTRWGPGLGGPSEARKVGDVGPGDLLIIPPNTPHQVNFGAKTEMTYLAIRIDPKRYMQLK